MCCSAIWKSCEVFGYRVPEYAVVISSLDRYFRANMALLQPEVRAALFVPEAGPIYTKVRDCCARPVRAARQSVSNSLVADGASIEGTVRNSIIFRDVRIGPRRPAGRTVS